jgi:hypothetical protein
MVKLFRCWIIVAGNQPTAFRGPRYEDLLPTLRQLQRTQEDVELKWFERGRLWASPEAARTAMLERRRRPDHRGREWRPGGDHRDPKARPDVPRDVRRALFKKRLIAKKTEGNTPAPDRRRPFGTGERPKTGGRSGPRRDGRDDREPRGNSRPKPPQGSSSKPAQPRRPRPTGRPPRRRNDK